jgi:hypothetical protein
VYNWRVPDLVALTAQDPSEKAWDAVCEALCQLQDSEALARAIAVAREPLGRWPAMLRRADANRASPWTAGVFEGRFDRRLELVGWASIRHHHEYEYLESPVKSERLLDLVAAFARRLDPTFDPPNTVLESGDDIRYASGCGGGRAYEKHGGATQWIAYDNQAVEHSGDMETNESWTAHGVSEGATVTVGCHDYIGGYYDFTASGPAPAVFELAPVWSAVLRGMPISEALELLHRTWAPWRRQAT